MNVYTLKTIEFRPYAETGEFACIGVAMYSQDNGYFDYRVCKSRQLEQVRKRVHGFFPEIPDSVFRGAVAYIKKELRRVKMFADRNDMFYPFHDLIENLCRPRENIIRFGNSSVLMTIDPNLELEKQFQSIVMRSFIDVEGAYIQRMKNEIREKLDTREIQYKYDYLVKAPYNYEVTLPFYFDKTCRPKALRPLDLDKKRVQDVVHQVVQWRYNADWINNRIAGIEICCPIHLPRKNTESYIAAMDMLTMDKKLYDFNEYSERSITNYIVHNFIP